MRISDWSSDVCSSDLADGRAEPINSQTTPKMAVGAQRTRWASITTAAANVASTPVSVNACTPKYSNDPKCPGRLGTRVPRVLKAKARKGLANSTAAPPRHHQAQRKTMTRQEKRRGGK